MSPRGVKTKESRGVSSPPAMMTSTSEMSEACLVYSPMMTRYYYARRYEEIRGYNLLKERIGPDLSFVET